jgi:serine/threonine protein phosphatase PrpC
LGRGGHLALTVVTEAGADTSGAWRIIGASVTGVSHERAGIPCQDAHQWETLPDGGLIVAIADGAGSAPRSAEGAHLATETAITALVGLLQDAGPAHPKAWQSVMHAAFVAASAALATLAGDTGAAMRDFATTLTLVAATPDAFVAAQIGDGVVVAEGADGEYFLATTPQRGEYANEVALLTAPDAVERMEVSVFPATVRAFAATTDGLLRLAVRLPAHEPHVPFFRPLFAFLGEMTDRSAAAGELAAFLTSERVSRRTDDDKTLVLATSTAVTPHVPPVTDSPAGVSADG